MVYGVSILHSPAPTNLQIPPPPLTGLQSACALSASVAPASPSREAGRWGERRYSYSATGDDGDVAATVSLAFRSRLGYHRGQQRP